MMDCAILCRIYTILVIKLQSLLAMSTALITINIPEFTMTNYSSSDLYALSPPDELIRPPIGGC